MTSNLFNIGNKLNERYFTTFKYSEKKSRNSHVFLFTRIDFRSTWIFYTSMELQITVQ